VADSKIGFSYSLPADWEFVAPPTVRKQDIPYPSLLGARKGDACITVALTAKHGDPASVVVVTTLPFSCYGQTLKPNDLQNLGAGAAEGLKQTFKIHDSVQGNYSLGSHAVWIERAKGNPGGHAGRSFEFETVCTMVAKGAVCWTAVAADWNSLRAFEQAPVTLDSEAFAALVPEHAFVSSAR
jgi:hypothetical protein